MKYVSVVQHTQSEWLGAIEDHLEGRGVRFGYARPFTPGGNLPSIETLGDGLILLGGGPWGAATPDHVLPTLDAEVRLARACLMLDKPVVAFGLGAQILSLAAEGTAEQSPLVLDLAMMRRSTPDALGGFLPDAFPMAVYMRDRPCPPAYASILAIDAADRPAVFQIGRNAFGFAGHPGIRRAMIEDLIMEAEDAPANSVDALEAIAQATRSIEDALIPIMTGLVSATGWITSST